MTTIFGVKIHCFRSMSSFCMLCRQQHRQMVSNQNHVCIIVLFSLGSSQMYLYFITWKCWIAFLVLCLWGFCYACSAVKIVNNDQENCILRCLSKMHVTELVCVQEIVLMCSVSLDCCFQSDYDKEGRGDLECTLKCFTTELHCTFDVTLIFILHWY